MTPKTPTLIIDDEPLAVKLIADYAARTSRLEVVYAGCDVMKAVEVLQQQPVELVFIDIQMPRLTGIELMQLFNQHHHFIITSAYPDYALDAFRFHVIDFLLKPITFDRFCQSIDKFDHWQATFQKPHKQSFLSIKADRKQHKIPTGSIRYIEGLRDYISIHTTTGHILALQNMKDILEELPAHQFVRIHRSYIIPRDRIAVIEGHQVRLSDGTCLPIGETYRASSHHWIEKK